MEKENLSRKLPLIISTQINAETADDHRLKLKWPQKPQKTQKQNKNNTPRMDTDIHEFIHHGSVAAKSDPSVFSVFKNENQHGDEINTM